MIGVVAATTGEAWAKENAEKLGIAEVKSYAAQQDLLLDVQNGRRAPWGYRGWVHLGIDLPSSNTINNWIYASANPPFKAGRLGTWQNAGSQHPGGCHAVMGDGSTRFLSQNTAAVILTRLARMADGVPVELAQ